MAAKDVQRLQCALPRTQQRRDARKARERRSTTKELLQPLREKERERERREEREKEQTLARESKFRVFFRV